MYKTCVEPLVRGIFDGYNATVFAYGQTVRKSLLLEQINVKKKY